MSTNTQLGDLQHAMMQVLWHRGEASVAEVHSDLQEERGLAPTTIATMLVKMERKGIVEHRIEGRKFIYRPVVSESEVRRSMVGALADRLFEGDVGALVSHLLSEHEVDSDEIAHLKTLIADAESTRVGGAE